MTDARVIWKYALGIVGWQRVALPRGAEILSVQEQFGGAYLWALVDASQPVEMREVHMIGTGHAFPASAFPPHLASVQFEGGNFVWHFFAHRLAPASTRNASVKSSRGGSVEP